MGRSRNFAAGAQGEPAMHHARMDTGSYSFEGFGATEADARRVVADGFRRHMKQSGVSAGEWKAHTGGMSLSNDDHIAEWFGINVKPVYPNTAYRDHEPI